MSIPEEHHSILIIGSGNAGFSAALSAALTSPNTNILLVDKCPASWAGGNSYFTAGAFRTAHDGLSDLLPLVNNVSASTAEVIDLPPYTTQDFTDDLERVTQGRCDQELGRMLVEESNATIKWLFEQGVRFQLSFNRQAYRSAHQDAGWGEGLDRGSYGCGEAIGCLGLLRHGREADSCRNGIWGCERGAGGARRTGEDC